MNILVALQIGLREIAAHKFRSFLSMLGIVLGVSSLISTVALTTGIERGTRLIVTGTVTSLNREAVIMNPEYEIVSGPASED